MTSVLRPERQGRNAMLGQDEAKETITMTTINYVERILYVFWNEDGDITASTDADRAIEELSNDYGGLVRSTMSITVKIPRPVLPETALVLPELGGGEATIVVAPAA